MTMLNFKKASVIKNLVGKKEIVMRRHTKNLLNEKETRWENTFIERKRKCK